MKKVFIVFIVFIVLGLVSLGCLSLKDAPLSITKTDSSYHDTVKIEREITFQDPFWINEFYYCDSDKQIRIKEIENLKRLFDSALKVNPLKETIYKSHWGFVNRNVISKPEIVYVTKYKDDPKAYLAYAVCILLLVSNIITILYFKKASIFKKDS